MNSTELWITNGQVLTGAGFAVADVAIDGEKIAAVVPRAETPGTPPAATTEQRTEVDATGLWVLPGGVDAHVHFGMPLRPGCRSLGWRESSGPALLGGTTTVIDLAKPERDATVNTAVDRWLQRAQPDCLCDFGLHATITEASQECLAELPSLVTRGVPTFKGFLAYKDRLMLTANERERLMRAVVACGGKLLVHAEDGELNAAAETALLHTGRTGAEWHATAHPPGSELQEVETALDLAQRTGCPLTLVHLSLAESLQRLRRARVEREAQLDGEVCLQHLFGSAGCCDGSYEAALRVICSPPIRSVSDSAALLAGLAQGDLQFLSTDHCEFDLATKLAAARHGFPAIPNGVGGVGERLTFTYGLAVVSGDLTPERWIQVCCEEPAKRMGLGHCKGRLAPGYDADVVLFDPSMEHVWEPLGASDRDGSIWRGRRGQGRVEQVWRRGKLVVKDRQLQPDVATGRFMPRRLTGATET